MWLSVLLYKSPQTELPCCLLLSTNSIYFLLAESASLLGHGAGTVICELEMFSVLGQLCRQHQITPSLLMYPS